MVSLLLGGILTVLVLPLWTTVAIYRNYVLAQSINLPIVISPVDPFNPLWIISRPYLNPLLSRLPAGLSLFTRYNYLGWVWRDKNYLHSILGPAFIIVTPGENQLIVGDANACDDLFKYYRQWPKNPAFNNPLNTFGHSVATAEGDAWKRQRKITTAAFNERNSGLVWEEAVKQTKQMLQTWLPARLSGVTTTVEDTNLLALHVLTGAGFGISYEFDSSLKTLSSGHIVSYRDALRTVMDNIFITYFITSAERLPAYLLPKWATEVLNAVNEFKSYMTEMVDRERNAHLRGEGAPTANLMSSIIRASDDAQREAVSQQAGKENQAATFRTGLSDSEIWGNMFIYNVAGHETTAGTLTYAIGLLACHPEWQEWLRPELKEVFGTEEVGEDQYHGAFARLKRCHAIMYETLRLYAPVNGIPRHTGSSYQVLSLGSSAHTIPPHTAVFINNAAVQVDPAVWGSDALDWRPGRWLQSQPRGQGGISEGDKCSFTDTLILPAEKAYIPWASGPRVCPGKKFSQVEFVAAIAVLFHQHRVAPVVDTEKGETLEVARQRTMQVLADSDMALTIRLNHPQKLKLTWEEVSVEK